MKCVTYLSLVAASVALAATALRDNTRLRRALPGKGQQTQPHRQLDVNLAPANLNGPRTFFTLLGADP